MAMTGDAEHGRSAVTVLVVDDDPAVRDSLKFWLELEGFFVRAYAGGPELLNDSPIPTEGCLVIDQMMPGMTGLDVVDALRERGGLFPTILITPHADVSLRNNAASRGVTVLEKPFLERVLVDAINEVTSVDRNQSTIRPLTSGSTMIG
jgi:two-component system, LuxR family, response regulator FixJ